jgi:hypothetical protein
MASGESIFGTGSTETSMERFLVGRMEYAGVIFAPPECDALPAPMHRYQCVDPPCGIPVIVVGCTVERYGE